MLSLRKIGWIACILSVQSVHAQLQADTLSRSWLNRDFLDLSSERSTIYVNPFVGLSVGNTTGIAYPATSFENNRGARFEAIIDSVWKIQGALQERQGTGDPLLSWWAFQFVDSTAGTIVLPSWGRTKWRNKEAFVPGQALEFDGARAIGVASRTWHSSNALSSLAVGMDNLHEGLGEGSVFWSRSAAPLPFVSMQWANQKMHAKVWLGNGIGAERGPPGSTAESIYARQRISRLGWGWKPNDAVSTELIWMHVGQIPFNGQKHMTRNWGGPQLEWKGRHWSCYAAMSWDWNRLLQKANNASAQLSRLIRIDWESPRIRLAGEWQQTSIGATGLWDPQVQVQLPMTHSGNPILSNWGEGLSVFSLYLSTLPIYPNSRLSLETNARLFTDTPLVNPVRPESAGEKNPKSMLQVLGQFQPISKRPFFVKIGMLVVSWEEKMTSSNPGSTSVTYCIALTHKISKLGHLPYPNPGLVSNLNH